MKIPVLFLFAFLFVTTGYVSLAQNSIFMGKIVDENNRPIPGARVKVSKAGNFITEVVADNDGLYYTELLPSGYYNVDLVAKEKRIKVKKVFLKEQDKVKWFYNLKLQGDRAEVIVTANDPFMAHKLSKIEESQRLHDFGVGRMWIIKTNSSTGITTGVSGIDAPLAPPHIK